MLSKFIAKAVLAASATMATMPAMAQHFNRTTIDLAIPNGQQGFRVNPGDSVSVQLPRRLFVHKLMLQVDSRFGNSGAELLVNGDRKGNVWLSPVDPQWTVTVEQETSSVQVVGVPALTLPQGVFSVRAIKAVVSDTDWSSPSIPSPNFPTPPSTCHGCERLSFPLYYHTVMGNVSNRAIMLVDRLADFTNYHDYGVYLLPIKKAAAEARAVAEARGDASAYGRPYFMALLVSLDQSEAYLSDTFERNAAFQTATELLALREHIRDILD